MEIAIKQDRQSKKEELIKTREECKKMLEKGNFHKDLNLAFAIYIMLRYIFLVR